MATIEYKPALRARSDFSGHGAITGTLKEEGVLIKGEVRLYNQVTGILIDRVMSSTSGEWGFYNLDPTTEFMVVGVDHTSPYKNAKASDRINPS